MAGELEQRARASSASPTVPSCAATSPHGRRARPDLYRDSHALLHVSWTEGLPQVLLEAFAAGLPMVATDVGGIREAVGDAVLLVPPGDPEAAAEALDRLAGDPELRARLVSAGHEYVSTRTLAHESMRVADFIHETCGDAGAAAG